MFHFNLYPVITICIYVCVLSTAPVYHHAVTKAVAQHPLKYGNVLQIDENDDHTNRSV